MEGGGGHFIKGKLQELTFYQQCFGYDNDHLEQKYVTKSYVS